VIYIEFFPYCLFVSNSQVIGCEDRLRNDLYCVGWGVKLYSIQSNLVSCDVVWRLQDSVGSVRSCARCQCHVVWRPTLADELGFNGLDPCLSWSSSGSPPASWWFFDCSSEGSLMIRPGSGYRAKPHEEHVTNDFRYWDAANSDPYGVLGGCMLSSNGSWLLSWCCRPMYAQYALTAEANTLHLVIFCCWADCLELIAWRNMRDPDCSADIYRQSPKTFLFSQY